MRGFDDEETAQIMMDGLKIYYNFIRPHMALKGKTPAEKAGIRISIDRNRWLALINRLNNMKK